MATQLLKRTAGERTILLMTDGMPNDREATLNVARLARAQGITLVAIGIGHADEGFLATLTLKPELAGKVATGRLEKALGDVIKMLHRSM